MAFPNSGQIKIFPAGVSIISGQWALASDAQPQPNRPVSDLQTYYDARVPNVAVAPCLRRDTEKPPASGVYVPSGGVYELQFSASTIGLEFYDGAYPGAVAHTTDFIKADFPMGMTITSPSVWVNTQTLFGPFRDRNIVSIQFKYFGSTIATYAPGTGLLNGNQSSGSFSIIPVPGLTWSFIQVLKTFGFAVTCNVVVAGTLGDVRSINIECFILANYNTALLSVSTLRPEVAPGDMSLLESNNQSFDVFDPDLFQIYWDVQPGDTEDPEFPGMTGGVFIPRANIKTFNAQFLEFRMPTGLGIPYGGRRLMLVGTSINAFFVGKFPIQNYNITLVDGSGLYNLTPGKRNDTYYDRSSGPPTPTVDLRMPDPRIKTGYFNG
jgi:hypothetical protein